MTKSSLSFDIPRFLVLLFCGSPLAKYNSRCPPWLRGKSSQLPHSLQRLRPHPDEFALAPDDLAVDAKLVALEPVLVQRGVQPARVFDNVDGAVGTVQLNKTKTPITHPHCDINEYYRPVCFVEL